MRGRSARRWLARAFLPGLAAVVTVGGCREGESALLRGDRFWADSNYTAALAEYRLALGQRGGEEVEVLGRVAHAYIQTGQFERAREHYDRLLRLSPQHADQAVFDYVLAARRARGRADRYGMAIAVEAALALRPGLPLDDMAAPLARYYASTGDGDRALDFYERALSYAPPDSVASLLFEIGELYEGRGDCDEAISAFNDLRIRQPRGAAADQARWHIGNCSFVLGKQARQAGDPETALRRLDATIELGVPQNLLDQAWFERGEALFELGRREEALEAYYRVLELNRLRTGQLTERAQQRIDQIRFGRNLFQ